MDAILQSNQGQVLTHLKGLRNFIDFDNLSFIKFLQLKIIF